MGWVKDALKELSETGRSQIRPHGGSMKGRIESGQLVTLVTAKPDEIAIDDVVLVRWKGNYLLHLIKDIRANEVLIGNNLGKLNGWVSIKSIIGKVVEIENKP